MWKLAKIWTRLKMYCTPWNVAYHPLRISRYATVGSAKSLSWLYEFGWEAGGKEGRREGCFLKWNALYKSTYFTYLLRRTVPKKYRRVNTRALCITVRTIVTTIDQRLGSQCQYRWNRAALEWSVVMHNVFTSVVKSVVSAVRSNRLLNLAQFSRPFHIWRFACSKPTEEDAWQAIGQVSDGHWDAVYRFSQGRRPFIAFRTAAPTFRNSLLPHLKSCIVLSQQSVNI